MLILKKPARPHALGEPILHADHPRPVTRRDMLSAGLVSVPAVVMAPAWLGALLKSGRAGAATLDPDLMPLKAPTQCNIAGATGGLPFICFDLSGGANLVGSEVLVGVKGGQTNFLSTAGYGKLGLPGSMVPTSSAFVSSALGLLWHSDGGILRGILSKATTPATAAGTNGAVICAMSQNDTGNNPHNPMYGIAKAVGNDGTTTPKGSLLTLIGNQSTVSGGNSQAPMQLVDPTLQPTKIATSQDDAGLVQDTGSTVDPVALEVLQSQARISGGVGSYTAGSASGITGA